MPDRSDPARPDRSPRTDVDRLPPAHAALTAVEDSVPGSAARRQLAALHAASERGEALSGSSVHHPALVDRDGDSRTDMWSRVPARPGGGAVGEG